jgi:hypothetical protein
MVREIRIYYEGDRLLKSGFDKFFEPLKQKARGSRCEFRFIFGGGDSARDFADAVATHSGAWNILLKDSEGPAIGSAASSLCKQQGLDQSHAGSIFWMVQMMESWFHADKDALAKFYGDGFNGNALKPNPRVEEIPKKDLEDGLRAATRATQKGAYHKTAHGPMLLALINRDLVREAAPNCDRMFQAVFARLPQK